MKEDIHSTNTIEEINDNNTGFGCTQVRVTDMYTEISEEYATIYVQANKSN